MPKRIILDPAGPKGRPQALRQRHMRQLGYIPTEPSRRLGSGAEVTVRQAKPGDAGAEGSLIAMVTTEQLETAQAMAHLTCGQCFEPKHDGACYQD
jgi:hypothetical protein